ncbi:reverse transcriptase domain-containing protein, partial [Tanacetum coccineum]
DWNLPFELMCDASDFTIGAVLGQRKMTHFQPIHYANKTMTEAQIHYTTTEKEMLAVVYAFEKFRPCIDLVLSKSIVYTDHSALKYLMNKQDAKPRLLRLENPHKDVLENKDINEHFPLETLGAIASESTPWDKLFLFFVCLLSALFKSLRKTAYFCFASAYILLAYLVLLLAYFVLNIVGHNLFSQDLA